MRTIGLLFLSLVLNSALAQSIQGIDLKTYSIQKKGVTDLVFEISNPALTKSLNEQMIFGKLQNVNFTVYWTQNPERISISVNGLPEGFKEIKDELKISILSKIEPIIPISLEKKFAQYSITPKSSSELVGIDKTNQNHIPEYRFKLGAQGELAEIIGVKPVGLMNIKLTSSTFPWSDQKFVTTKIESENVDGPQVTKTNTTLDYVVIQGIGLPKQISTKTTQIVKIDPKTKPIERSFEESITVSKYKVNSGEALKWFISQGSN